tara:strand:- start:879 stop:1445 length:567 start_codon:yes stop_codon:yes gene_type:complete
MKNIKVIKKGISVKKVLKQLNKYPEDWDHQKGLDHSRSLVEQGYDDLPVGNLQLIMGVVEKKEDFVGDSEFNIPTPAYDKHTEIRKLVQKQVGGKQLHRCGFLSLAVEGMVGAHIDEGTYYHTRDRYHLSIQGQYKYFVGNESIVVDPGTFFWFNNKLPHGTVNLGDVERISFVFDIKHHPTNPHHKL